MNRGQTEVKMANFNFFRNSIQFFYFFRFLTDFAELSEICENIFLATFLLIHPSVKSLTFDLKFYLFLEIYDPKYKFIILFQ